MVTTDGILVASRWRSLSMSFILVILAGVGYCFPLYSDALMHSLQMSPTQLTMVPALLNVGGGLVAPAGLCISKYGLRVSIVTAGCIMIIGYLGMYAISTIDGGIGSVIVAYLLAFIMGQGSGWIDCISVTANTTNYSTSKGQVTGITKCIFGLAAPTVTLLYTALHSPERSSLTFLLLVVLMIVLVVPLSTLFVSLDPSPCPPSETLHPLFSQVNVIGLTLALLQLLNFFLGLPKLISLAVVIVLFSIMVALPLAAQHRLTTPSGYTSVTPPTRADTHQGFYYTGNAPLKSLLFWSAFVGLSAAFGSGLAFMNNQAQLLPPDIPDRPRTVGALLTVVTASSAASRVIIGLAADRVKIFTRPGYIVLLISTMIAAFLILSSSSTSATLFLCGPLIGFCFGGLWSLTPPLCADLFGDHNLPLVYSSMRGTLLVGALLIASATMSIFYSPEDRYSRSFSAVAVVLTVAGLLPWLAITFKTRSWYSSLL